MTFTLDWQIRSYLKEFNEESAALPLLIAFMLHADLNGELYPSTEYLADELGASEKRIIDARKWLLRHGVYLPVPYTMRGEKTKKLPVRQFVYQLTGLYIAKDGSIIPYLYMTPEGREAIRARVVPIAEMLKVAETETSISEVLDLTVKGISISQGSTTKKSAPKGAKSPKPKKERARNPMFDAIAQTFGYTAEKKPTKSEAGLIGKAASELTEAGYTPEQIPAIYKYCIDQGFKGFTARALAAHAGNWKRSVQTADNASALNGLRIIGGGKVS